MGRVAVKERLSTYPALVGLGIDGDKIWPNFALDISPRTEGVWLVLRWGINPDRFGQPGGRRTLNVWVYQARQVGTDYAAVDAVMRAVVEAMLESVHFTGSDGSVLRCADFNGFSADLVDEGYDAIARSAEFTVLCADP